MSRFEVHTHTEYSNLRLLDSTNRPRQIIDTAISQGLAGIAITDHECLSSHIKFQQIEKDIAEKHPDFKIAYGNEIYLTRFRGPTEKEEGGRKQNYSHFILIAKDQIGYKMLSELSSQSWLQSYFDRGMERVPTTMTELEAIIEKYGSEHLIATTACLQGILSQGFSAIYDARKTGNKPGIELGQQIVGEFVQWCATLFADDFYLEIAPSQSADQLKVNNQIWEFAKKNGFKCVLGCDAHFLRPEDRFVHKSFLQSKFGDREVDSFYAYAYMQSEDEIIENLRGTGVDYATCCRNSMEIWEKIEKISLLRKQHIPKAKVPKSAAREVLPPEFPNLIKCGKGTPAQRYWLNTCCDKLRELGLAEQRYFEQLEYEADIMLYVGEQLETDIFDYPLFLKNYMDMFWEYTPIGAGRGSSVSGLNHYLLGITQIDPIVQFGSIDQQCMYWRFLNKDRVELPDIDFDIAPSSREKIFSRIREEEGDLRVVQVCTFGTETSKGAILAACRGLGVDVDTAQYLSALVPVERGFVWSLSDCLNGNPHKNRMKVMNLVQEVKKYEGLREVMLGIEGLICRRGIHASGIIFTEDDPYEYPYMKAPNGAATTQWDLHDVESAGATKYDMLVTEVQDIIHQCVLMLQEHGEIEADLTLREVYNKYLHPDVLPIEDPRFWQHLEDGDILGIFQFDSPVGAQVARELKPQNPLEMANANSIMRLMGDGERPQDRYKRHKDDISQWYRELSIEGFTNEDVNKLEKHFLSSYGTMPQQEQLMLALIDLCGFSLKESNDARKIIAKKQLDRIPELKEKILNSGKFGDYIWNQGAMPMAGYSFSILHSLVYSYIGLQTIFLSAFFNPIYWNTAFLRVKAGLAEEDATNYGKIATAIGRIVEAGIPLTLIDINKSQYAFEPDLETGMIVYGMKGLNGVGGEIVQTIIENRPYESVKDFLTRVPANKTVMLALVRSGAFDQFGNREDILSTLIAKYSEPKQRITMQNFNMLSTRNLLPEEFAWEKELYDFDKSIKKSCKKDLKLVLKQPWLDWFTEYFDIDLLEDGTTIPVAAWDRLRKKRLTMVGNYIKKNKDELLEKLNEDLFKDTWEKYGGTRAEGEMDALGFYFSRPTPLEHINRDKYDIEIFSKLEENEIERFWNRNGIDIPIYRLRRICGTVIAKNDLRHSVDIVTPEGTIVNVGFGKDYYAKYGKQVSEVGDDGKKHVVEKGYFKRGTHIVVQGFRNGLSAFRTKQYKNSPGHQLYKISQINSDGSIIMENTRIEDE